jgi:hypothetical protein
MRAYHFTGDTLLDGRPVPPVGEWLVHEGRVEMCESGLHASRHPLDALGYAPGNLLHLVECEDVEKQADDKLVCRRRKIVKSIDAKGLLREFARWCALQVIHLWDAPDVVREYLETGSDELLVAADRAADRAAAGAAYGEAAYAARAAFGAATHAVWAASGAAAWAAARAAAREVHPELVADQRDKFQQMVDKAFGEVA